MAAQPEPEIVLYDLACIRNACFSPTVWKIRLMLNYKKIPYRTVFLEFPDIEPTLKGLGLAPSESATKFTVPTIHHVPTNKYIMDSVAISEFLESVYPSPAVPLTSSLGREVESQSRAVIRNTLRNSITPREVNILSPRSQDYFRRTREAAFGHRLEDLLDLEKEEENWKALDGDMRAVGELMRTNKDEGPFILGAKPTYTDFFLAGALQSVRMIDEGIFQKIIKYPGYKDIYEGCAPYLEKNT